MVTSLWLNKLCHTHNLELKIEVKSVDLKYVYNMLGKEKGSSVHIACFRFYKAIEKNNLYV